MSLSTITNPLKSELKLNLKIKSSLELWFPHWSCLVVDCLRILLLKSLYMDMRLQKKTFQNLWISQRLVSTSYISYIIHKPKKRLSLWNVDLEDVASLIKNFTIFLTIWESTLARGHISAIFKIVEESFHRT